MAWELGQHIVPEYYEAIEEYLARLGRDKVIEIIVEYETQTYANVFPYLNEGELEQFMDIRRQGWNKPYMALDTLIHEVIDAIEKTSTTDNGAHNLYIDPAGHFQISLADLDHIQTDNL